MGILDLIINTLEGKKDKLQIGDIVEIISTGEEGEVEDIIGDKYEVLIYEINDVEIFKRSELRKVYGNY